MIVESKLIIWGPLEVKTFAVKSTFKNCNPLTFKPQTCSLVLVFWLLSGIYNKECMLIN